MRQSTVRTCHIHITVMLNSFRRLTFFFFLLLYEEESVCTPQRTMVFLDGQLILLGASCYEWVISMRVAVFVVIV